MRISIIRENEIENIILPSKVFGSFWITSKDKNGLDKNLISIEAKDNRWQLVSNNEAYCVSNGVSQPLVYLENDNFYTIVKSQDKSNILIYCSNTDSLYSYYDITDYVTQGVTIGKENCMINYQFLGGNTCAIQRENDKFYLINLNNQNMVYKDNIRVNGKELLRIGEVVFIYGLRCFIVISSNKIYLAATNPKNMVSTNLLMVSNFGNSANVNFEEPQEEIEVSLYNEGDYFHRTPRFNAIITPLEMKIDSPPSKEEKEDTPLLLTIGPMLTMSMTSLVMGYTAVNNVLSGNSSWSKAMPSIVICVAMLASVFIWPMFSKTFQEKLRKKKEAERQQKYSEYINSKKEQIRKSIEEQQSILKNSYPSTKECEDIITNKYTTLWQRRVADEDFLEVNLGYGSVPMKINIHYPEDHFSMAEDNLKDMVSNLSKEPKILNQVPIVYNFYNDFISGIVGKSDVTNKFIKDLIIQLVAHQSYDNLKIVVLTSNLHENEYNFVKMLPHIFSDDKRIRLFGTKNDEYKEICYYLDRIYSKRLEAKNGNGIKKESIKQHYLIITDNFKKVRNYDIFNKILETKENLGFELIINDTKVTNLPDQTMSFIELNEKFGEVHSNIVNDNTKFELDNNSSIDYYACSRRLANIPIEINTENEGVLPNKLGFLEMYDVGKVEQLNSLTRWKNNNPVQHLESTVGIGKNGELINLDLHEKFHGPHGLIAGMTGSGKSEFIITYILSMAVNYHPDEVQFVLIDYKGGGLTGAFENKTTNIKLPHLVGTITNLDKVETKRCLASIDSELKRRQKLFNEARELSNESTMDIYKYQQMYRDGIIKTPISHLFIISDEFAELKQQQPEFMEQLIQTARIGRSLGVHLILATQKPSGVVDAQIWSNTRFRICLRVQDKGDSQEVIKSPDAAYLTQTGRFYFQVGFNELFTLGQAAWAGGKYIPNEKVVKNIDTTINFIDNIGYIKKTVDTKDRKEIVSAQGEELLNIVKYLDNLAKQEKIRSIPLWLDKIPEFIRVEDLKVKYSYEKEPYILNPIIGEYDIPSMQTQKLLTLPLTKEGNSLIYGASGMGKENFITTMLYSSMLYNDASEVNYYILDFGSESLRMFNECPLVGDVLTVDDTEKITNLFKMIDDTIEERKKIFANYNGDYLSYIRNSENKLPNIVVVINNYEAYQENNTKFDDMLVGLTRECSKYGIYFVVTVSTPNGVRFKLKQNFPQILSLQQNTDDDYITVMGNVHKMYPSKIFGRGITRKDDVYEFQTALVDEKDKIPQIIREKCRELKETAKVFARPVPTLPECVSYKDIMKEFSKDESFVVGLEKSSLDIVKFNFIKNDATIISSNDITQCTSFVNPFINQILARGITKLTVINCEELEVDPTYTKFYNYYDSNFNEIFTEIHNTITEARKVYEESNYNKEALKQYKKTTCIIVGLNSFKSKLNDDNRLKFGEIFTKSGDLDIINYVIIDSLTEFKKIELEPWYKSSIKNDSGIWIGNGIGEQFTIKVATRIEEMKEIVPENFCFVINRGIPKYVKFVESFPLRVNKD